MKPTITFRSVGQLWMLCVGGRPVRLSCNGYPGFAGEPLLGSIEDLGRILAQFHEDIERLVEIAEELTWTA